MQAFCLTAFAIERRVLKLEMNTAARRFPAICRSCLKLAPRPMPIGITWTPARRREAAGIATLSYDLSCAITISTFLLRDRPLNKLVLTYLRAAPVRGPLLKNGALLMALNTLFLLPLKLKKVKPL